MQVCTSCKQERFMILFSGPKPCKTCLLCRLRAKKRILITTETRDRLSLIRVEDEFWTELIREASKNVRDILSLPKGSKYVEYIRIYKNGEFIKYTGTQIANITRTCDDLRNQNRQLSEDSRSRDRAGKIMDSLDIVKYDGVDTMCPICQEDIHKGSKVYISTCNHVFDPICMYRQLETGALACSLCRTVLF